MDSPSPTPFCGLTLAFGPPERLKQRSDRIFGNEWSAVGDLEERAPVVGARADADPPVAVVVTHRVLDQVRNHPIEEELIAVGLCRLQHCFYPKVQLRYCRGSGVESVLGRRGQVDMARGRIGHGR